MKAHFSLVALALMLLVASPAMAERRHDYRNYDRGHRYEGGYRGGHGYHGGGYYRGHGHSSSSWGVSVGFGWSNYGSYRPAYCAPAPVYRSYDCGEPYYYPARSYYYPSYGYTSVTYSSGGYCGPRYYSSHYYSAPSSYYSVRFHYGR